MNAVLEPSYAEDFAFESNPFLSQKGLLQLHAKAQAALDKSECDTERVHLLYASSAIATLADRFGPTSEYRRYFSKSAGIAALQV
jgi:hypothetical protein